MIDRATVDRILAATNIVDVVGEFVTLRKAGVNYKGLCPFHDDKTPSFIVSPSKNICHCFACGEGGNAVNFLMKHEQITYPEALRWLANKYHIEIQERELSEEEKKEASDRESMFIVNEWAITYFEDILNKHPDGRAVGLQYFRSRGFRDDIIAKFRLGYALPEKNALALTALQKGYKAEYLVKTGLCYMREDDKTQDKNNIPQDKDDIPQDRDDIPRDKDNDKLGGDNGQRLDESAGRRAQGSVPNLVDRYRGRVIFPWFTISGKVVAFGGRLLDSRTKGVAQKYVNSPESEIYHKGSELYGLFQAKKAIVKEDRVYMVEGYTDVLSMHQCGIENVVANSGTALTIQQIKLLHRFTSYITLLYDGDEAGIHAALRGTDMLLQEGMNVKVLVLPDGDDPDSFARKHTAEEYRQYIEEHQTDFIEFKTDLLLRGVADPIKRSEAINSIVKSVSVIPDAITRDTYIHVCSEKLRMNEQTLITQMNKFIRQEREERQKEAYRARLRQESGSDPRQKGYSSNGSYPRPGNDDAFAPYADPNSSAGAQYAPAGGTSVSTPSGNGDTSGAVSAQRPDSAHIQGADSSSSSRTAAEKTVTSSIEAQLIQAVIRHGEQIVYENVETEDGEKVNVNVAQYVAMDLGNDGLSFSNPHYNQILSEAIEHSGDPGFKAESYFTQHHDFDISNIASRLAVEHYSLSKSLQIEHKEETLRNQVRNLCMHFKFVYFDKRLKDIQAQIKLCANDMPQMMALLKEYKERQEDRNVLATELGINVLTH